MKAIRVSIQGHERHLILADARHQRRREHEILVDVHAVSLNRGEVHSALNCEPSGARPGWEYGGVVIDADAGSRFKPGDRVIGLVRRGAWAQRIVAPERFAAVVPEGLSFEAATTVPVAGLTAALCLSKRQMLTGQRVLVTASTGAVGRLAVQLAAQAGCVVTALVRRPGDEAWLRALGAHHVFSALGQLDAAPPFDLVLDGVGGAVQVKALQRLAPLGICVQFGHMASKASGVALLASPRFPASPLGGKAIPEGFFLEDEIEHKSPAPLLRELLDRVRSGHLDPGLLVVRYWEEADATAKALLRNEIKGRAVLRVPGLERPYEADVGHLL